MLSVKPLCSSPIRLPPSVWVETSNARFVINVGDGFQRFATEHQLRVSKLTDIFITRISAETIGGLIGLLLTLKGQKGDPESADPEGVIMWDEESLGGLRCWRNGANPKIRLWGPTMLFNLISKSTTFANIWKLEMLVIEVSTPIPHVFSFNGQNVTTQPGEDDELRFAVAFTNGVMTMLVIGPTEKGKLDVEKAKALNVPPGPLFADLKNGKTIEIDGRHVGPLDVCAPSDPGLAFYVHDEIPSTDSSFDVHDALTTFSKLLPIKACISEEDNWIPSHPLVFNFGPPMDVNHKMVIDLNYPIDAAANLDFYPSQLDFRSKLHSILPDVFPLPSATTPVYAAPSVSSSTSDSSSSDLDIPPPLTQPLTHMILCPKKRRGVDEGTCLRRIPNLPKRPRLEHPSSPLLTFLGTGSAIPSLLRNVSSILLEHGDSSILMDCGEGSLGQLFSLSNDMDLFVSRLRKIKLIFLSHHHADHHLGLLLLLRIRRRYASEDGDVTVLAPSGVREWLEWYDENIEKLGMRMVVGTTTIDDITVEPFVVEHFKKATREAWGAKVRCRGERDVTVVYSGDTLMCEGVREAARDADVLIHEATFEDSMSSEARDKMHSTTQDACTIAREANVKTLILTHFSQRYTGFPVDWKAAEDNTFNLLCAFDLMEVQISNMGKLSSSWNGLQKVMKYQIPDNKEDLILL